MDGIERLIVIEDIRALQSRYVRLADSGDWQGLSELFLPDAPFTAYGVAGDVQTDLNGREAIAAGVAAGVGSGIVIHHLFSYEIDVQSPVRAHGVWAMEDWIDRSHETGTIPFRTMRGYGHYHVDYAKTGEGWRIAGLKLQRTRLDYTY